MQQIYRRKPMPKCDFDKVAKQLYWNHTLVWVFSCKFAAYFQNTFFNTSGCLLLSIVLKTSVLFQFLRYYSNWIHFLNLTFYDGYDFNFQKQLSTGVLRKRCSENIQKTYRRTSMPKCDFNKIALQSNFGMGVLL